MVISLKQNYWDFLGFTNIPPIKLTQIEATNFVSTIKIISIDNGNMKGVTTDRLVIFLSFPKFILVSLYRFYLRWIPC